MPRRPSSPGHQVRGQGGNLDVALAGLPRSQTPAQLIGPPLRPEDRSPRAQRGRTEASSGWLGASHPRTLLAHGRPPAGRPPPCPGPHGGDQRRHRRHRHRALLSALEHAAGPILLVNCDPTDASRAHFDRFAGEIVRSTSSRRPCGSTARRSTALPRAVRRAAPAPRLRRRDPRRGPRRRGCARRSPTPRRSGPGSRWGPFLIGEDWQAPTGAEVLYMERPWMPCVLLRPAASWPPRSPRAGRSTPSGSATSSPAGPPQRFLGAVGPALGHPQQELLPAALRRRTRLMRPAGPSRRSATSATRARRPAPTPRALRHRRAPLRAPPLRAGPAFKSTPIELHDGEVHHYLGVTRSTMVGTHAAETSPDAIEAEVIRWMADRYGYTWPGC